MATDSGADTKMSEKDPIRLFITHCFNEHEEYSRVFEYLESRDNFYYFNYSDPEVRPEPSSTEALQEAIRQQLKNVEIAIFPVGIYAANPKLMDFELRCAQAFEKPILAIKAFGGTMTASKEVLDQASEVVEWNARVITDAINRLARNQGTGQWDVIEFDMD